MRLRVIAELDNGFRQTAQFDRDMRAGDRVLVEVMDDEHISVTQQWGDDGPRERSEEPAGGEA
jgi:hypothetical protein